MADACSHTSTLTHACQPPCFPRRYARMSLGSTRLFKQVHRGAVTWMDLDRSEGGRYLLSGSADASVAVFDLQHDPASSCGEEDAEVWDLCL